MIHPNHPLTFGTAYYPDHWPRQDWARDLDHIKAIGIDVVRFGEFSWSWFEPRPGELQWDPYDAFVELARQRELRLVLCTPTATPPPWFLKRFADCRLVDSDGHPCHAHRHYWCWNHRDSRSQAEQTIRALARHFKGHPAVEAWQIDNEVNYAEGTTLYDFNPHALADFRVWLRGKYGDSLDALNAAWYTNFWSQRYGDWEEIGVLVPPKSNPNAWLDFARWRDNNLAEMIRWQARLIREEDPQTKVGTNIPETGVRFSAFIGQDYADQAAGLDWVGTDLYAANGKRQADLRGLGFCCDLIRSAAGKARFIVAETQGGPHQRTWPCTFAPEIWDVDYLDQSVRTYAEHGAAGAYFFLFRATPGGMELGMNGLTNADGSPSARTAMVARLAKKQKALATIAAKRARRPLALIHYSRDTIRYMTFWPQGLDGLQDSYRGWHRLLDEAGYRIEFIFDHQLTAPLPQDAELLVLPQSHLMSDSQIDAITATAEKLPMILGPHTAMLDEHGQLRQSAPGGKLAAAAGVTLGYLHDANVNAAIKSAHKVAPITAYRELGSSHKRSIVASFGKGVAKPAIVRAAGVTWCAFDVGDAYEKNATAGQKWLQKTLLDW